MISFGFFDGMQYGVPTESFETFRIFENSIDKGKVIAHIETLNPGLTTLPSYDMFTGEKLHAGVFRDSDFVFPYEFLHYYKNYDIGIPYEYEKYLKSIGVG